MRLTTTQRWCWELHGHIVTQREGGSNSATTSARALLQVQPDGRWLRTPSLSSVCWWWTHIAHPHPLTPHIHPRTDSRTSTTRSPPERCTRLHLPRRSSTSLVPSLWTRPGLQLPEHLVVHSTRLPRLLVAMFLVGVRAGRRLLWLAVSLAWLSVTAAQVSYSWSYTCQPELWWYDEWVYYGPSASAASLEYHATPSAQSSAYSTAPVQVNWLSDGVEQQGYYISLDPQASCAAPNSRALQALTLSTATNSWTGGLTGGWVEVYWEGSAGPVWCLSQLSIFNTTSNSSTLVPTGCVTPSGNSSDLLSVTVNSTAPGVGHVTYSFPRGALVLGQRSPSGEPTFWQAMPQVGSSPSQVLPYSSPVSLWVWDDSPQDNAVLPGASSELTVQYQPPLTSQGGTFTSSSPQWASVSLNLTLQQSIYPYNSFEYYYQDSSYTFPGDATYTLTWQMLYQSCQSWLQQTQLTSWWPALFPSTGSSQSLWARLWANSSDHVGLASWFCGGNGTGSSSSSSAPVSTTCSQQAQLYAAYSVPPLPALTFKPVAGSAGTAAQLTMPLPQPLTVLVPVDPVTCTALAAANNASTLLALSNPLWQSNEAFTRPGSPVVVPSSSDIFTGLVITSNAQLTFSFNSTNVAWQIAGVQYNASGFVGGVRAPLLTANNYSFPLGALVGRIGSVLSTTFTYFQVFPTGTTSTVITTMAGPLYLSVWCPTQPQTGTAVQVTLNVQYVLPLSSLTMSWDVYQPSYHLYPTAFPVYPAGYWSQSGGTSSGAQPVLSLVASTAAPQWRLPASVPFGNNFSYSSVGATLTANLSGLAPSTPVPPPTLPYNRSPYQSTATFGVGLSYEPMLSSTSLYVSDPMLLVSDPRREEWYTSAQLLLSWSDDVHGQDLAFQPGVLGTGFVMDSTQALNNSVTLTYSTPANSSDSLYSLQWASLSSAYYVLPSAASSYTFVDPNSNPSLVASGAGAVDVESCTGVYAVSSATVAFTLVSGAGQNPVTYQCYNYSANQWEYLSWQDARSIGCLPYLSAGGYNFTQGTIVARLADWATGYVSYYPLFLTGSTTTITLPYSGVSGVLYLSMWPHPNVYAQGLAAVQVNHSPPPMSISPTSLQLNVTTVNTATNATLRFISLTLPANATTAALNLTSPVSGLPTTATVSRISLTPVFYFQPGSGYYFGPPAQSFLGGGGYSLTYTPHSPSLSPTLLSSTSSSLSYAVVQQQGNGASTATVTWTVDAGTVSGWVTLDLSQSSVLSLNVTALAGGLLTVSVLNVSAPVACFNATINTTTCTTVTGFLSSPSPSGFSLPYAGVPLGALTAVAGVWPFALYSSSSSSSGVSSSPPHLVPSCGPLLLALNALVGPKVSGRVAVFFSYSPPLVNASLLVQGALSGAGAGAGSGNVSSLTVAHSPSLFAAPLMTLTQSLATDGSLTSALLYREQLSVPRGITVNLSSTVTYDCLAWLNGLQEAVTGQYWSSSVQQHWFASYMPTWPPLAYNTAICPPAFAAITYPVLDPSRSNGVFVIVAPHSSSTSFSSSPSPSSSSSSSPLSSTALNSTARSFTSSSLSSSASHPSSLFPPPSSSASFPSSTSRPIAFSSTITSTPAAVALSSSPSSSLPPPPPQFPLILSAISTSSLTLGQPSFVQLYGQQLEQALFVLVGQANITTELQDGGGVLPDLAGLPQVDPASTNASAMAVQDWAAANGYLVPYSGLLADDSNSNGTSFGFTVPALWTQGYHRLLVLSAGAMPLNLSDWVFVVSGAECTTLLAPDGSCADECPDGCFCTGDGRCWPEPGWWSPTEHISPTRCALAPSCPGALEAAPSAASPSPILLADGSRNTARCSEFYTGDVCDDCVADYYHAGAACRSCGSTDAAQRRSFVGLVIGASVIVGVIAAVACLSSPYLLGARVGYVLTLQQVVLVGVTATQLLPTPTYDWLTQVFTDVSIVNFDVAMFHPGCTISALSYVQVFWITLAMVAAALLMFAASAAVRATLVVLHVRRDPVHGYWRWWRRTGEDALSIRLPDPQAVDDQAMVDENSRVGGSVDLDERQRRAKLASRLAVMRYVGSWTIHLRPDLACGFRLGRSRVLSWTPVFRARLLQALLACGVLVYLRVTTVVLQMINCGSVENEQGTGTQLVLLVDRRTLCYQGSHLPAAIVAWTLLVAFSLGFPLLLCIILRHIHSDAYIEAKMQELHVPKALLLSPSADSSHQLSFNPDSDTAASGLSKASSYAGSQAVVGRGEEKSRASSRHTGHTQLHAHASDQGDDGGGEGEDGTEERDATETSSADKASTDDTVSYVDSLVRAQSPQYLLCAVAHEQLSAREARLLDVHYLQAAIEQVVHVRFSRFGYLLSTLRHERQQFALSAVAVQFGLACLVVLPSTMYLQVFVSAFAFFLYSVLVSLLWPFTGFAGNVASICKHIGLIMQCLVGLSLIQALSTASLSADTHAAPSLSVQQRLADITVQFLEHNLAYIAALVAVLLTLITLSIAGCFCRRLAATGKQKRLDQILSPTTRISVAAHGGPLQPHPDSKRSSVVEMQVLSRVGEAPAGKGVQAVPALPPSLRLSVATSSEPAQSSRHAPPLPARPTLRPAPAPIAAATLTPPRGPLHRPTGGSSVHHAAPASSAHLRAAAPVDPYADPYAEVVTTRQYAQPPPPPYVYADVAEHSVAYAQPHEDPYADPYAPAAPVEPAVQMQDPYAAAGVWGSYRGDMDGQR